MSKIKPGKGDGEQGQAQEELSRAGQRCGVPSVLKVGCLGEAP